MNLIVTDIHLTPSDTVRRGIHPLSREYAVIVEPIRPWTKIEHVGPAALTIADEVENGIRTFTSTLTFTTADAPALPPPRTIYRARCADGTAYIIGTHARPMPVVTVEMTHAAAPGERTACSVKVTWKGPLPALRVIEA